MKSKIFALYLTSFLLSLLFGLFSLKKLNFWVFLGAKVYILEQQLKRSDQWTSTASI